MEDSRFAWFDEARFGLFVHWGLYSILGRGEWVMYHERIPVAEYARLADRFNPERFDAHIWASHAAEAGMRYAVLTARHHDGFSLWDSQLSDFTSVKSAARRDIVAEFVEAFRAAGLRVGLYYSLLDWRIPAYWNGPEKDPEGWAGFIEYVHGQVRELLTQYGKIDVIWFDGVWPYDPASWQSEELLGMCRRLQPQILVNDRARLPGDFDTPENQILPSDRHWESCQTLQRAWGYTTDEWVEDSSGVLRKLIRCAMGGGNLLLNVGPRPDGSFPEPAVAVLREVGRWLQVHGAGIYGSERIPYDLGYWHTRKGKAIFLYFLWPIHWPSWSTAYWVYGMRERVASAYIPATGQEIQTRWEAGKVCLLDLPRDCPDAMGTIALRLA
jgi:alpha-L-fucosidase